SLVFTFLVFIADLTLIALVRREEEDLRDSFVGIDAGGQGSGVGDLERDEALPFGLERRHGGDDAATSVGALADATRQDGRGGTEVLHGASEGERIRWHDE